MVTPLTSPGLFLKFNEFSIIKTCKSMKPELLKATILLSKKFLQIMAILFIAVIGANAGHATAYGALTKSSENATFRTFQEIDISGRITDETGQGLPGVNILVQGTSHGTTTDVEGDYNLRAEDDAVLVISSVGYEPQEIPVNGRSKIDVVLAESDEILGEVVVTALGVERETKALWLFGTGSSG